MLDEQIFDIDKLIEDLSKTSMKMSLNYAKNLANGVAEKDELKQLNELKKHLKFAKGLYKELNPNKKNGDDSGGAYPEEIVSKVKKLATTVGDIVRSMTQE